MPNYRPNLWTRGDFEPELWTNADIGPSLWTAPSRVSNLQPSVDGAAVARALDKARRDLQLPKSNDPPVRKPPAGKEDTDGHETLSLDDRLKLWAPSVTVALVSSALVREMTLDGIDATKAVKLVIGFSSSTTTTLATLRRPTMQQLREERNLGLHKTKDRKGDRMVKSDAIMAEATMLDFIILEALGRDQARHASLYSLLHVTFEVAAAASHLFKHLFVVPRPATLWGDIEPLIAAPGHASFPSGHATQAYAAVEVLEGILAAKAGARLADLARSVADNRVIAGVHYDFDSAAGEALGRAIGAWVVSCATGSKLKSGRFDASSDEKASVSEINDAPKTQALLTALWGLAKAEITAADKP